MNPGSNNLSQRTTTMSPFSLNDDESGLIETPNGGNILGSTTPFVMPTPEKRGHMPVGTLHDIEPSSSEKFRLGVSYLSAMGVCGLVFVAIASNLNALSERCGTTFLKAGSVFIARGIGAIVGSALSAKIYADFPGNETIAASLFLVVIMLIAMPSCTSLMMLHLYFFGCGLGTALTDVGCQIMTRKVQGKKAGPWLGANTITFGLSGALVPLIEMATSDLYVQYLILAAISLTSVISLWLGPDMEGYENYLREKLKVKKRGFDDSLVPHYRVEFVMAAIGFFIIGGKMAMTAYLNDYVLESKVLSANYANMIVLVLWVSIALGKIAGIVDQTTLTDESCPNRLSFLMVASTFAMGLIIMDYSSSTKLWIGVGLYGFFSGPRIGYCYDLLNRSTYPTELSMSIVMFGVNLGASCVPYFVPLLWSGTSLGPRALMIVVFFSSMFTIPLLYLALFLRYPKLI